MGKFSKLLGTAIVLGAAAGTYKYLKEYHNLKLANEDDIDAVKTDATIVKDVAKRTYIALKNNDNVSDHASDLLKATGNVISDAEKIAVTAGTNVSNVATDIMNRFDEDPEGLKNEFVENVKDMGSKIVSDISDSFDDIVKNAKNSDDSDDDDIFESFDTV